MTAWKLNGFITCPHCDTKGFVQKRVVMAKAGISGGKATAAVLTGGLSLLVPGVGLSRKQPVTELKCGKCGVLWRA